MEEFRRIILKVSDIEGATATIPATNDHTDGSWLDTDIFEGELFLNIVDNVLQTRTASGIVNVYEAGGSSVNWGDIIGTLSDQTDLQDALNLKVNYTDFESHSILVKQSGGSNPIALTVGTNTLVGRTSGGGSEINDLSVSEVKTMLDYLFTDLTDTPSSFLGNGGKTVKVNSAETGLEFVEPTDTTLIPTETLSGGFHYLTSLDANKNLENDTDTDVYIMPNAMANFEIPIGTQFFFTKKVESLRFVAFESGVTTINSVDGLLEMGRINCGASLLKIGEDEWNLIGELV